jgi:maleylacetoacetate isomerase
VPCVIASLSAVKRWAVSYCHLSTPNRQPHETLRFSQHGRLSRSLALNLKGIAYSRGDGLRSGAHRLPGYRALNPQALIPTLVHGDVVVAQSIAIIEYLEEQFPSPPLLPHGAANRASVRAIALNVACDMHPLNNLRVLNYLREELKHDEATVNRWYAHWIAEGFRGIEELVRRSSKDGRHCFGDSVTMADVCLVPQMFNARRFNCDVTPYPTLIQVCGHLEKLPAFAAAHTDRQPDAA